jgi:hypothetical protein
MIRDDNVYIEDIIESIQIIQQQAYCYRMRYTGGLK